MTGNIHLNLDDKKWNTGVNATKSIRLRRNHNVLNIGAPSRMFQNILI